MTDLLGDLDYVLEYIYNRLLLQWKHETQNNHLEMIIIKRQWNSHCKFGQETQKAIFLQKKEFGRDAFKSHTKAITKDTSLLGGEIW